jgi:hypothetical protein
VRGRSWSAPSGDPMVIGQKRHLGKPAPLRQISVL